MTEFIKFPSIGRLHRDMVVTEKIDGSNGCVVIDESGEFFCQSRNKIITPEQDNAGFARWAHDHREALTETLGVGRHYGEWFGSRIQRGYGFPPGVRNFALFNVKRWGTADFSAVPGLRCVPVVYRGEFSTPKIEELMAELRENGSVAVPGFLNPEGLVIYSVATGAMFKTTFDECDDYNFNGGKTWVKGDN